MPDAVQDVAASRVVHTKLTPPRVPPPLVDRARLHDLLDAHPGRLVLVSAPAGFGKTALVVDWLARREVPTAWLSLDRLDNDPSRFCAHLGASVARLDVPGAERAATLMAGLGSGGLSFPPSLLDALSEMGSESVIVLDDLHEVNAPAVMGVLEALVRVPGPGPRLVVLTRVDPAFATGRLRVSGELLEVRERELRFTEDEAVQLFDRLLPGVVEPALVRRLGQRTEGWVAGLRLAAIGLRDAADPAAVVESFTGSHRFVMDYLLEEAVERQTPEVQRFLLETSVLGRFSTDTCEAVTGDPEAALRLAEVEAANLFLVPLGGDREWFRYHHLFAELLRYRLGREQGSRQEELHRRASEWFEGMGDIPTAMEHAASMTAQDRLLELLDVHALDMLARSEVAGVSYWLGHVDSPLAQPYPMVLSVIGWLRVLTERAPDLGPVLAATASALDRVPEDYDPARKRQAAIHLDVLTAFAARYAHRFDEAIVTGERLLEELEQEDAFTRGLVTFNLGRVRMMLGEMALAGELLERSFGDNLRSDNMYLVLTGLGQAAAVLAQVEGVQRAMESLAAAVAFAEERGLAGYPAFSTILYHRGYVEALADELNDAEASFHAAIQLARTSAYPEGHANGLVGLARVALARRAFDDAEDYLVLAAALATGSNVVLMDTTIELEQARLAFARGIAGAGPPGPAFEPAERGEHWTTVRESGLVFAAWQAIRAEDWDAVRVIADELERESAGRGRGPAHCTAPLVRALLPDCPDRWDALDRALRLAATRGYIRPVLNGGEPVRGLLQAGLTRTLSALGRAHARLLLDRFDTRDRPDEQPAAGRLIEPLTDREEDALACLFNGDSNKAIARSMFVSVETVKTHLKHLYGKLGVSNRNEAVARARELGLAPPAEN